MPKAWATHRPRFWAKPAVQNLSPQTRPGEGRKSPSPQYKAWPKPAFYRPDQALAQSRVLDQGWYFANPKKSHFWLHLGWPWNGNVFIFSVHWAYFMNIWYIFWPSGTFCGYRVPFWYAVPRKIWQPWLRLALNVTKLSRFSIVVTRHKSWIILKHRALTSQLILQSSKIIFCPKILFDKVPSDVLQVHTNEILVLLGDNWFVERSAKQARYKVLKS
jgi:hypothetical protein